MATENNIPTCERCGTPMETLGWDSDCPLPASACQSIAALKNELEAARAELATTHGECAEALCERDSALKARDEALDQVVVLTEALKRVDKTVYCHEAGAAAKCQRIARDAFFNTSALAAQRKREIQGEAVDAAVRLVNEIASDYPEDIFPNPEGVGAGCRLACRRIVKDLPTAILNPTEPA